MTTVLVIEDMSSLREEILQMLELMGFQGIGAENGAIGVMVALRRHPDVIICDIMMPELDGYAVLQLLRQRPETARIPFVFLTARADRTDIRQGMNLGADDYLTKPFTCDELEATILARLCKRAAQRESALSDRSAGSPSLPLQTLQKVWPRFCRSNPVQTLIPPQKGACPIASAPTDAVICVHLHQFQAINSGFGLATGETILQIVANRLRPYHPLEWLAGLTLNEFYVCFSQLPHPRVVVEAATEIAQRLSEPYQVGERLLHLQVSLGVACSPEAGETAEQLLSHATLAMQWGRQQGLACQLYTPDIAAIVRMQQRLEQDLILALRRSEFRIHYQPQLSLTTGTIVGAETLLRWQHPELGLVPPATFIPIAEATGLIVPLGEWILQTVCTQVQRWQAMHLQPIQLAVNLSARQLQSPNLLPLITNLLAYPQLDRWLSLELTETTVLEQGITVLQQIKALGLHLAIDDFGTGYSSFLYLKQLPIDALKIDQSFIAQVSTDPHDAAITTAIIDLAQNLGLEVVAEGVETQEQLDFLCRQGCTRIQGNWFSEPLTAPAFAALLQQHQTLQPTVHRPCSSS